MEHFSASVFMSPELQQYIALSIVATAAATLLWRMVRPWFGAKGKDDCASGCGHCPANKEIPRTELGQPLVQLQLKPMNQSKAKI